jgi:polyisoprenyl-phosphate glycosyltransferase
MLSIVIPVYKSAETLATLNSQLSVALAKLNTSYEILYINDGSPDNSLQLLRQMAVADKKIKLISFTRNFGQHNAISAGLKHTKGDYILVMDCDGQNPVESISQLYNHAIKNNSDIVLGLRTVRHDTLSKKIYSYIFYKLFHVLTNFEANSKVSAFGIYSRKVVNSLLEMPEQNRTLLMLLKWLGYKMDYIEVEHAPRIAGKSSYSFSKLLNLAFNSFISYSEKPLYFCVIFGFIISLFSFLLATYVLTNYLLGYTTYAGWTSIMLVVSFMGGTNLFAIGVVGLYIGKTFKEVTKRPHFVIDTVMNLDS